MFVFVDVWWKLQGTGAHRRQVQLRQRCSRTGIQGNSEACVVGCLCVSTDVVWYIYVCTCAWVLWGGLTATNDRIGDSRPVSRNWCSDRSEEHTSELQSLMRISYAVFFL